MAASGTTRPRSGGFFKFYMFVWAVAAAAALAYLASLATAPDLAKSFQTQAQADADPTMRLASRALTEIGTVRRTVGDMQRDITQVREGLDQREANDKQVQSRIAVLEERVTSLATPPVVASAPPPPAATKQKAADKSRPKDKAGTPEARAATPDARAATPDARAATPDARTTARLSRLDQPEEKDAPEDPFAQPRVETGSLNGGVPPGVPPSVPHEPETPAAAPTAPVVTFGTPVVTPSRGKTTFAVQIGAGTSLDALRSSWNQLQARHDALSGLQPRFVAPKTEGGKYRLVAGPFGSKAEADKACTDMGVGRTGCFSTTFAGAPL